MAKTDLDLELKKLENLLKEIGSDSTDSDSETSYLDSHESRGFSIGNLERLQEAVNLPIAIYEGLEENDYAHVFKTMTYKDYQNFSEDVKTSKNSKNSKNTEKTITTMVSRKTRSSTSYNSFTPERINVVLRKNNFLLIHLAAADLSILKDFADFKPCLNILNSHFVSIKPIEILGVNVFIRDTMLLSVPGYQALAKIGSLYGKGFEKIELAKGVINNMKQYLVDDPKGFEEYALRDSLITLVHGCFMDDLYFKLGKLGVPLTLSQISTAYVLNY